MTLTPAASDADRAARTPDSATSALDVDRHDSAPTSPLQPGLNAGAGEQL